MITPIYPQREETKTAFGELSTAEPTPIFQYDFSYNINNKLWDDRSNNGTATIDSNRVKISTGAASNQSAQIASKIPVKYHPGQGNVVRFTALFTTGVANSTQLIGVGDESDGLYFGYNGIDFGILRRYGGTPEIRTLTITTKSTTAESIEITLDGDSTGASVVVTDATAGDVTTTANDIVSGYDWTTLGRGWRVHTEGANVIFVSFGDSARTGTYEITTATTAVGTFAQTLAGVTATDSWITQTNWNHDKFDGAGKSKIILDTTKGNVFEIRYQWLGYGQMSFYIEHPEDGNFHLVHTIDYANSSTAVSFNSPSLPLCVFSGNTTNTSDIVLYSASVGTFIEGKEARGHIHHASTNTMAVNNSTEVPILTIHNKDVFASKINRNRIRLTFLEMSSDTGKEISFKFYLDAVLTGASFSDVDTNDSMVAEDSTATAVTGGDFQFASSGGLYSLSESTFYLNPGQTFTVTQLGTTGTGDVSASVNWEELF